VDHVFPAGEGRHITAFTAADVATSTGVERHLIAAGNDKDDVAGGWLVRRSIDQGATWNVLVRSIDGSPYYGPRGVAVDSGGSIYVAGQTRGKSGSSLVSRWLIRKGQRSNTGTYAWRTLSTAFDGIATAIVCAGSNVYVAGYTNKHVWQVRKSTDGGSTWALVDNYNLNAGAITSRMTVDGAGNPIVTGWEHQKSTLPDGRSLEERFWIVRKGTASGTQWQTIDSFALPRTPRSTGSTSLFGRSNWAKGVAVDLHGTIFVTGVGVADADGQHWITRRLAAGSTEWTIDDDFKVPNSGDMQGDAITVDAAGNTFASGMWNRSSERRSWIVRRNLAPMP
jgi:hypothetical protein